MSGENIIVLTRAVTCNSLILSDGARLVNVAESQAIAGLNIIRGRTMWDHLGGIPQGAGLGLG